MCGPGMEMFLTDEPDYKELADELFTIIKDTPNNMELGKKLREYRHRKLEEHNSMVEYIK